jgi:hypothetical protein
MSAQINFARFAKHFLATKLLPGLSVGFHGGIPDMSKRNSRSSPDPKKVRAKPNKDVIEAREIPITPRRGAHNGSTRVRAATIVDVGTRPKPVKEIVGAIFKGDSAVRAAVTDNLRERSLEQKEFASRAHETFAAFNPTKYRLHARVGANYVRLGESPAGVQNDVIARGLDSFRNSTASRSLRLSKTDELDRLMKPAPRNDESIVGTIVLKDLLSYIDARSPGTIFSAGKDPLTICKTEIEAERRMKAIAGETTRSEMESDSIRSDHTTAAHKKNADKSSADSHLTTAKLVKENVDLQMATATSPESQLRYSVPDRADQLKNVHTNIQTFELRAGPSDVTSYHDFHNLQIAFEDVWTEMFDPRLAVLGKQLYEEYVRLKSFTGVDDGEDPTINTIDDLRHLMDEVRDFSRLTVITIPPALQPDAGGKGNAASGGGGSSGRNGSTQDNTVSTVVEVIRDVLDPVGAVVDLFSHLF